MTRILIAAVATLGLAGIASAQQAPAFNGNGGTVDTSVDQAPAARYSTAPSGVVIDYSRTSSIPSSGQQSDPNGFPFAHR